MERVLARDLLPGDMVVLPGGGAPVRVAAMPAPSFWFDYPAGEWVTGIDVFCELPGETARIVLRRRDSDAEWRIRVRPGPRPASG